MPTQPNIPTVGKIVYYRSYGSANGEYRSEPRAAIITATQDDPSTTVSLAILNPTGIFFSPSVRHGTAPGQWDYTDATPTETDRWEAAYEHAKEARQAYSETTAGTLALQLIILPAIRRYESGERTTDLLEEMEAINL